MIKQLFVDFDQLAPTERALLTHLDRPVTLLTAKAPAALALTIATAHLTAPQVAFGGGLVYLPGGRVIHQAALPTPSLQTLLGAVLTYFPTVAVTYADQHHQYLAAANRLTRRLALPGTVLSPAQASANPAFACLQVQLVVPNDFLLLPLARLLGNLQLAGVQIRRGPAVAGHPQLLITSAKATPAAAISRVAKHQRLALAACAGAGSLPGLAPCDLAALTSVSPLSNSRRPGSHHVALD